MEDLPRDRRELEILADRIELLRMLAENKNADSAAEGYEVLTPQFIRNRERIGGGEDD